MFKPPLKMEMNRFFGFINVVKLLVSDQSFWTLLVVQETLSDEK